MLNKNSKESVLYRLNLDEDNESIIKKFKPVARNAGKELREFSKIFFDSLNWETIINDYVAANEGVIDLKKSEVNKMISLFKKNENFSLTSYVREGSVVLGIYLKFNKEMPNNLKQILSCLMMEINRMMLASVVNRKLTNDPTFFFGEKFGNKIQKQIDKFIKGNEHLVGTVKKIFNFMNKKMDFFVTIPSICACERIKKRIEILK